MGVYKTSVIITFFIYIPSVWSQNTRPRFEILQEKLHFPIALCMPASSLLNFSAIENLVQTETGQPSPMVQAVQNLSAAENESAEVEAPSTASTPLSENASVTDRLLAFIRDPATGVTVNWLGFPLSRHLDLNLMSRLRAYSVAEGQTTRYVATTTAGLEFLVQFNSQTSMSFSTVVGAGGNVNLDTNAALNFNNEAMAYVSFNP